MNKDMKMTNQEKRWRAESDADTLARYEEIMGDANRRNAAIKIAKEKAADLNKRASIMTKVSGKTATTPAPKKTAKPKKK